MILIGSRALILRAPHLLTRQPEDFDFLCSKTEFDEWFAKNESKVKPKKVYEEGDKIIIEGMSNCEFEIIKPNHSSILLEQLVKTDKDTLDTSFGLVPSLDLLFTIKDAHKYKKFQYSPRVFWKTAIDWHMMSFAGAKIRPEYEEFSKLRKKESYIGQKYPKLNVNKQAFFADDNIVYRYDHDDLHRAVCPPNETPAYEQYLEDGEEVKCSKEKFFAVSERIRLRGVCEEAATLALERGLIEHKDKWASIDECWRFALAKVATTITSGYFREYAYNNLFAVIKMYNSEYNNFYERFTTALVSGKIKVL